MTSGLPRLPPEPGPATPARRRPAPPREPEVDDFDYVKLVVLAIAGALAVYWGLL